MFQIKIDELFQGMPNVFVIADDILITGFNGMDRDHNAIPDKVLWICRQAHLKLNKDKYLFRCTSTTFFEREYHASVRAMTLWRYKH